MKKRVMFCLFLSLYLLYTHKEYLKSQIEEFEYLNSSLRQLSESINPFIFNIINENGEKMTNIVADKMSKYENFILFRKEYPFYAMKVIEAGYDFEEHRIVTEDGFILTSWRIPGEVNEKPKERRKRKPVMMQHGLFDSSYAWLILNATDCLPMQLAREGYDVWITNSRGNFFSADHLDPEYDSNLIYSKFWDFTFHEMGVYDLPANIWHIRNITGWEKINYIGHSQGTVQYFLQYTLNPLFIESTIDKYVAIGTVVNVFNTTSKIVHILHKTYAMIFMEKIFFKNVFTMNYFMYQIIAFACRNVNFLCKSIVQFFIEDYPTNRIDYSKLFQEFYNIPAGTSARNINHWIQLYSTKEFRQFDYGREINMIKYGKEIPPLYDLSKFKNYTIPSLMTISNADPFSKIEDCQHLFEHINKNILKLIELKDYNHMDYLWSSDASRELYIKIIDFLK